MILLNNPYKTIAPLILVLVLLIPSLSQAAPAPPSIVSFSPTVGSIGTVVTLTGTNFSSTPTNNIVYFGATKATVTAATATQLTVTVPTGATYAPITVLNTLTGLLAYSNSNFTPTFTPNKGDITSSDFSAKVDFTPGLNPFSVAIADLDDDGKADLAVANYGSNSVSVFRNTSSIGSVSYAAKIDHTTDSAPLSVATGDLDGDGKADLAVTNGNTVSVFRNTCSSGIISFATKVDISSTNPTSVAIGDLDGDGKADIVVTNENSNTVSVFRNTGSSGVISFAAQVVFTAGTTPISVAIGDFNGDGKADLVVANVNSNTVSVFRNTGNTGIISYAAKEDLAVATNPYSVAIGDLDGDGKADLAVANFSSNIVSVFRNNGSSGTISYAPKVDFITGDNPYLVRIGDLNGDGKPDLVVANYASNTVSVFRNTVSTGIISYAAKVDLATGSTPNSVGIGDLDGDGRADLAVANYNSSTVSIIRNNPVFVSPPTITSFTPTSGGTGTVVTLTGTNFSSTPTNNIVYFGATKANVTSASTSQLSVVVPTGATYQPITVTVNGLTAYSSKRFVVTFPSAGILNAGSFSSKVDFTSGNTPFGTAIGDLDGDGKTDIAVVNIMSNTISVYRNTSVVGSLTSSSFASKVDFATGSEPISVSIGDLDGDGKLDLVVTNQVSRSISVYRNTSTTGSITPSSFAAKVDFLNGGSGPNSIAIGDLDDDGKPEIIVGNNSITSISIFKNTSATGAINAGSFAPKIDITTGITPTDIAIGDLDGDSKPDLAIANFGSATVSILKNTTTTGVISAGSFANKVDFATGSTPNSIAIGDFDGDGKFDLSVANGLDNTVSIIRNISTLGVINSSSFAPRVDFAVTLGPRWIAATDIDGDGKLDLALTNADGSASSVSVLKNTSSPGPFNSSSFMPKVDFATGPTPTTVAIGDLDGDGKPDLTAVNQGSSTVSVIRNTVSPPIPTILSFAPSSGAIGTPVTITGSNFSPSPANNIVYFGAIKATVTSASATQLTVVVPIGATYQPITVTVNGLTAYSNGSFVPSFNGGSVFSVNSFAPRVDLLNGYSPISAGLGDINLDGKLDIAIANPSNNFITVFEYSSSPGVIVNNSFNRTDIPYPAININISDIDRDGFLDMISVHGNNLSVFKNKKITSTISISSFEIPINFQSIGSSDLVTIDLDEDGRPDVVTVNESLNNISIYRNIGNANDIGSGLFSQKIDLQCGTNPYGIATGDLDSDGKYDLVVTNYLSNTISIFKNTSSVGNISFSPKVDYATGINPYSIAIGDLDSDGKSEIVVSNFSATTISIFRNISATAIIDSNSFATKVDFSTGGNAAGISISDLNGDSKLDLVVANSGGSTVSLFRNTTSVGIIDTNSFIKDVDIQTGNSPYHSAIGDVDGDGKPEIITSNNGDNTVSVIRNLILPPISITSFTPSSGIAGASVTITGTNFGPTPANNTVKFNGTTSTVTASTSTSITTTVPVGATTGPITVTVNGQTATSSTNFTVIFPPTITSFTPTSGIVTTSVTITGTNFDSTPVTNTVKFNGTTAIVTASTSTSITTTVPVGATTGPLTVTVNGQTATSSTSFTVILPPTITSFSPSSGIVGTSVTITGTNFDPTPINNTVKFNGTTAIVTASTSTSIATTVPVGATNGPITVTVNGQTATSSTNFTVIFPPTITSFSPTSGIVGTSVTITGTNFDSTPVNNSVKFNGTTATVTASTSTSITTTVPVGATTGPITVTVNGQTATSSTNFTVIIPPTITSFTPASGTVTTSVTITGTNFNSTPVNNTVKFNGTTATVTASTSTSITTTVPVGATTGPITVTVNGQTATSGTNFTVIFPPTITSFTPASGIIGAQVKITGTNFSITPANNIVKFNGTTATITGTPTATSITTTVPTGATTGKITVEVDGRTATSTTNFYIGSVSRLGRFVVDKTSGCAPLTVTILDANLVTSGECTLGKPCFMNAGSGGSQQTNQFTFNYTQAGTYTLSVNYQTIGADDITITVNAPTITLSPSSTICSGTFTNLIASGASTYSWSPALGLSTTTEGSVIARPTTTTIYVVIGTDTNGCTQSKSVTVTVNNPCVIPNLANGKGLDSYRIFSIPLKLSDKKIETVLASVMQYYGGYDQDKWRLVHYSNGNNLNFTQGLSTIEEGKGYWLLSVDPLTINVSGTVLPVNQSTPFIMNLDKGWNQIGNPFGFDILWSDVLSKNSNTTSVGELYVYNPATISFIKSDKLPAWGGGFVNTTAVSSLTIPIAVKQATGGRLSTSAESVGNQIDQPSWFVPLKLQQGEAINDLGGIGMHDEALIGRDKYDENSLPRFVKFLELNSYHDEYFQTRFMRDVVPSTSNYNWNLYVESNFGEGDVKLSWEYETFSRNNAQLLLYDKQAKVIIDMKKVGEYKFGSPSTRELTIMYAIDKKHLSTESLTLGLPFPNPLVLETTIPFITGADEILINVYDMLGRKVKEVARSNFETGYHEIVWQGDDYLGEHVSPGMYIIRVSGSNSPAASVRILVK